MNNSILYVTLFCLCMSLMGTMIGALIGVSVKNPSEKLLGLTLSFAAGLMLIISIFELIPEAIEENGITNFFMFSLIGIFIILIINYFSASHDNNTHIKMAFLVALGIMLHNFPEGLVMGFGFMTKGNLGFKMSVLIAIHDIPEGIVVAAPLNYSKVNKVKILVYTLLTALPAFFGALIAIYIGRISPVTIGASLSVAAGIMLYVVLVEMLPESKKLCGIQICTLGMILGSIFGGLMIKFM
ncbi:ZIP family metal transporter [Hathewaya limosa]|uniref:ZIP family zinc transporter n=1 Tax=Hathewaya limosa TaxID=1536 RepID=A0ABU0JPQ2_HATLI|nr:ZIP family metal transporter [Hathewaya limosa]MDQ0478390.1 ZIP family zinc transporter [Hathewaya limosa]